MFPDRLLSFFFVAILALGTAIPILYSFSTTPSKEPSPSSSISLPAIEAKLALLDEKYSRSSGECSVSSPTLANPIPGISFSLPILELSVILSLSSEQKDEIEKIRMRPNCSNTNRMSLYEDLEKREEIARILNAEQRVQYYRYVFFYKARF